MLAPSQRGYRPDRILRRYDTLAWTAEWYFDAEMLEAANAAIVNYHHRLPMT